MRAQQKPFRGLRSNASSALSKRFLPPYARAGAHAPRDHEGRVEGQGSLEPEWLGRLDQAGGFAEKLPESDR